MSFGQRLELWRAHRGLSMAALGKAADMHTSSIHRIIHGQQEARESEIKRLATALDVTQGELLEAEPPADTTLPAA